jgi:hypothetical protein
VSGRPDPDPDFLTDHRAAVDLRILFSAEDWLDYCAELDEMERGAKHCPGPPGEKWPYVLSTALIGGRWVHCWLRLGHLRDYLSSLLTSLSPGPTLGALKQKHKAPSPAPQPPEPVAPIRIEVDDE